MAAKKREEEEEEEEEEKKILEVRHLDLKHSSADPAYAEMLKKKII